MIDLGLLRVRIREEVLVFTALADWRLEFSHLRHWEEGDVK